jgi:ABC-2 type transport system permease protein
MSPTGSLLIFGVFGEFFSGLIIPIPLMPEVLKKFVYLLPFRYASDLPFRIYAGNIGIQEALVSIIIQFAWIIALVVIGRFWIGKALKRVTVQGG